MEAGKRRSANGEAQTEKRKRSSANGAAQTEQRKRSSERALMFRRWGGVGAVHQGHAFHPKGRVDGLHVFQPVDLRN